jgi:pilus assembly protein Flp/PilA
MGPRFTNCSVCTPYHLGMVHKLRAFLRDETAATAIEYSLLAAGISIAIISIVKGVGTKLNASFSSLSSQLK